MDANKAKWYGIVSTFIVGLLQMLLCYGVLSLFFWNASSSRLQAWVEIFSNFSDLFIPILFLVCFRWSRKIGERIILQKEDAYKASIHHLNWVMTLAYLFTIFALISLQVFRNGFDKDILSVIAIILWTIAFCFTFLRLLNYIPSALGAIPLSYFLKRYQ